MVIDEVKIVQLDFYDNLVINEFVTKLGYSNHTAIKK